MVLLHVQSVSHLPSLAFLTAVAIRRTDGQTDLSKELNEFHLDTAIGCHQIQCSSSLATKYSSRKIYQSRSSLE